MNTFKYEASTVYFRDGFVPFREANVSIASSPVLYGLSIYTVMGAHWNDAKKELYVFRLEDHYKRLVDSAGVVDFQEFIKEWPYTRFEKMILDLLKHNTIKEDVLIRVGVFVDEILAGTRMHGLKNSVSAFIYPLGEILPLQGAHVCVSSWHRTPDNAIPSRAKINGSYVNASLMKNEAIQNGFDDAIALDEHGHVSEGTVTNLFIVLGGKLVTPGPSTDLLEGITRGSIMAIADTLGVPHTQRNVDRSELYRADEVFLCGSSARITPILSIDKRKIGDGNIGPITQKFMTAYEAAQRGTTKDFPDWRLAV
jgi:branched-chain amino acid aminotransferase